jgi:Flp pilus assembly protein TadG
VRLRRGVAAVEFALVAPVLALLMLVGTDLSIFMRTQLRLDETATELALVVTQYQKLYTSDFTDLFNAAQTIAGTTQVTGLQGATIITGIHNNGGRQTIAWQQKSGASQFSSLYGAPGSTPTLPAGYVLPSGGTLIAVEVSTLARPWVLSASLMGTSSITSLRSYALDQPRLGDLSTVNPGTRP